MHEHEIKARESTSAKNQAARKKSAKNQGAQERESAIAKTRNLTLTLTAVFLSFVSRQ
jgi:hypothetical protein